MQFSVSDGLDPDQYLFAFSGFIRCFKQDRIIQTVHMKFESDSRELEDPTKSSEPGVEHAGWGWWFAREEGGHWTLVSQGY